MSTMGEDDFDWDSLEDVFAGVDNDQGSVTILSDVDLLTRYEGLTQTLMDRGEAMNPQTREARDIHSERYACLLELKKRNLK